MNLLLSNQIDARIPNMGDYRMATQQQHHYNGATHLLLIVAGLTEIVDFGIGKLDGIVNHGDRTVALLLARQGDDGLEFLAIFLNVTVYGSAGQIAGHLTTAEAAHAVTDNKQAQFFVDGECIFIMIAHLPGMGNSRGLIPILQWHYFGHEQTFENTGPIRSQINDWGYPVRMDMLTKFYGYFPVPPPRNNNPALYGEGLG